MADVSVIGSILMALISDRVEPGSEIDFSQHLTKILINFLHGKDFREKQFIQPTTSEGKHNVIIQCRRRSRFWQRRTKCAASYFQTEIASFIKVALLSSFLLTDWVQEFISRQQFLLALALKRPSFLENECAMISIYSAFLCLALTVRYKDVSRFYGNYALCSGNLAPVKEKASVKGRYVRPIQP